MSKKFWSLFSILVVAAMALAACTTPAATTTAPEPTKAPEATKAPQAPTATAGPAVSDLKGTITLWHAFNEAEIAGLNEVIAAYQATHPGVTFDVLYTPFDDLRGKFETSAATGGGPSLLLGASDWGPAFYEAGLVADLTGLASADLLATVNPAALGAVQYKGALVGLPHTIKGVVMFRNASIIAEPATDFADLAAKAKAATKGDVVGADLERGFFFAAAHLNAQGGRLMEPSGDPAFDTSKGVAWLNLLNSFSDAGPAEYYTDNDVNLFKAGKAGIIIDGTWNIGSLVEAVGPDNLVIDPWPAGMSGYVQTDNIYLSANASGDDQAASADFMEFFLSPEAQAVKAGVGHIPSVSGVEVTDKHLAEAATAFAGGVAFPVIPEMGSYWGAMDAALNSVFNGEATPEEALATANTTISLAVTQMRGDVKGTITLWHALTEGEIAGLNAVIAAFQEKYPNVTFDVLYTPFDDLRGKYETAAATGGGPTVLIGAADWGPAFYNAELVADLTPFATTQLQDAINAAALGSVQYKGALVGLPFGLKGVVMYRNTSIVAEPATDFADLVAKAQAATAGGLQGADLERGFFFSAAHLTAVGGGLMDADGNPTFNDANGVAWLNLLSSFSDAGPAEYYTDNDVNLFKAGQAGVIIDGTWNLSSLAEAIGAANLAVDPWPAGMSGYVQNDNVYLSANAAGDDQIASWLFIQFLESSEAQKTIADNNPGFIPNVKDVEVSDPLRAQAVQAFAGGVAFPVIPEMGAYWGAMDAALNSVFNGEATPEAALQTAFDTVSAAIADMHGGN